MSKDTSLNQVAWMTLFDNYNVLKAIEDKGFFEITAPQIKTVREPRLMTKFDHKENLPDIFKKNNLSILPISRGSYVISQFDAYKKIEQINDRIEQIEFPEYIESIDRHNITSEAVALNAAFVSGVISEFLEEKTIWPTLSGRMGSKVFDFNISNTHTKQKMTIEVKKSQIEIDGGFEGERCLALFEAKNYIADDFLIRQLYYPYRLAESSIQKKTRPVFMSYSNGIFTLYEYEFQDVRNYNSLVLVKQKNYSFESTEISMEEIEKMIAQYPVVTEPEDSPFPQADSFKRVINLVELLYNGDKSKEEITQEYAFNVRQSNYYTDAGRYLGLISKSGKRGDDSVFSLTSDALRIMKLNYHDRQLAYIKLILEHKVFRSVFLKHTTSGMMPTKTEITEIMKISGVKNIDSETTYLRRSSTVSGWINWILEVVNS
jgi:hypothetical protein